MIILEGTDCVGKSTLAEKLAQHYRLSVQALGPLPHDWHVPDSYIYRTNPNIVQDRWWWSEFVYAAAARHVAPYKGLEDSHNLRLAARIVNFCGGVQYLLTVDEETLLTRLATGKTVQHSWVNKATILAVQEEYRQTLYAQSKYVHTEEWSWLASINENLKPWRVRRRRIAEYNELVGWEATDGWGSFTATHIFVGDKRGTRPDHCATPCNIFGNMTFAFNGSSPTCRYLSKLLDYAGINEVDCWFTNAHQTNGHLRPQEIKFFLPHAAVIALGEQASLRLAAIGIDHIQFYHPSYLCRFHHRTAKEWGELLKRKLEQWKTRNSSKSTTL